MHDATECGVWGGLYEVAWASEVGMRIEKEEVIVLPEVEKICQKFDMDPYTSISEGTLIITCRPQKAESVVRKLRAKKIPSSMVGEVISQKKGITVKEGNTEKKLEHPRIDPFWVAFAKALGRI
jgi:hydrogenase maturation factor